MTNVLRQRPVKGTTASVNMVNTMANTLEVKKLEHFSSFHNFSFEEHGIRVWKAYAIGNGMFIPNENWGWALHKSKGGSKRFSQVVKDYLIARYDLGEKTGIKKDPKKVADDMRRAKLANDERRFNREDWLSKAQIRSFFSRMTAARRKQIKQGRHTHTNPDDDDDLDEWIEEIEAIEAEDEQQATKHKVLTEIALHDPVIYDSYDLCEIYQHKELKQFNVKMFKEICCELEIPIKCRDVKKVIEKLATELSKCSCKSEK
ncbi:hypothetical protein AC249_AIPGENE14192 [Exaiptasia diaphana]|nr:hypothetical protein AC249_AIPGENE14192 [Exaiptasia diaphana]